MRSGALMEIFRGFSPETRWNGGENDEE